MIKDSLNSILDNLKERTTNPFLGTLIVVWVIHNWKLVYSLFYFDSAFKLKDRLGYIDKYFTDNSFTWNLCIVVLLTLIVLLFTYCMLSISRLITDTYDKMVLPFLTKLTDRSSVVLKSEYVDLKEVVRLLEIKVEEERLSKISAQNDRDQSDLKLIEFIKSSKSSETTIVAEPLLESTGSVTPVSVDPLYTKILNTIATNWSQERFDGVVDDIISSQPLTNNEIVKVLLRVNFIELTTASGMSKYYGFTDEGKEFLKYYNRQYIDN